MGQKREPVAAEFQLQHAFSQNDPENDFRHHGRHPQDPADAGQDQDGQGDQEEGGLLGCVHGAPDARMSTEQGERSTSSSPTWGESSSFSGVLLPTTSS